MGKILRILKNGIRVPELKKAITLKIYTKCPAKWILIDTETGQKYIGSEDPNKNWIKIEE